jgi:uncharacterized membrane protein
VKKRFLASSQANFWAGLAIVFPAVVSVAVLLWLFKSVASITDTLLIFLPPKLTHGEDGLMYWYWKVVALVVAVCLICLVGLLARNYFGRRIIEWVDAALLRIPLLNKIYGTTKQVNDAFSSSNKTSFRTVVLVEFPREGAYSLGFITGEQPGEPQAKLSEKVVCVFIPLTPNPTSGFLLLIPENKVTKLEMSVPDGIKYIISLGSIIPDYTPAAHGSLPGAVTGFASVAHD